MPKPYHTPKSERDELIGKLADAEARLETISYLSKAALAADPDDLEEVWMRVNQAAKRTPLTPIRCGSCGEADNSKGSHGLGRCKAL